MHTLESVRPGVQPGLSETVIHNMTSSLPFRFPKALVEMYRWHNGIQADFFPGFGFESLEKSLDIYQLLANEDDGRRFTDDAVHWFPIFRSSGADFYCVLCAVASLDDSEVLHDHNELGVSAAFVNLECMLQTLLECYSCGRFYVDNQGYPTIDVGQLKKVAANNNPGIKRWQ
jgi:hypothetical protein